MRRTLIIVVLTIYASLSFGQSGVGINSTGAPANAAAGLDVDFHNKGMLVPRLTTAQRDSIANPVDGLLIFNMNTYCFNFYRMGLWYEVCGNCIGPQAPTATNGGNICENDTIFLFASTVAGVTYSWTGPNGFTSTQQNPMILNATPACTGTYAVVTVKNGCPSSPSTTTVIVYGNPSSSFTANPPSPNTGQSCTFTPVVSGASYGWTFQNGNPASSTLQNPSVQWTTAGTYNVSLTVTLNGCSSTTNSTITVNNCGGSGNITYTYTGASQSWTVPPCVTSITVDAQGAAGGGVNGYDTYQSPGGNGGRVQATVAVTSGHVLVINVGGQGDYIAGTGGFNGGGSDGIFTAIWPGAGGGGATSIYDNTASAFLVISGGGGGGGGDIAGNDDGGAGGGTTGANGASNVCAGVGGGQGGTQIGGGAGGVCTYTGGAGTGCSGSTVGQGGASAGSYGSGGGGGGYYGGGGGSYGGGGGGGSSYTNPTYVSGVTHTQGYQSGNGQVIISW